MSKVWDILPPKRKLTKTERKAAKKRSKGLTWFFALIFIIVVAFIYYGASKNLAGTNLQPTSNQAPTAIPTSTPISDTSQIKDKKDLKIKLLNGSGQSEELDTTYKLLENNGFVPQKTENTLNLYEQTIIYYQPSQEKHALEIAEILKKYQAKVQKFSQETEYDLIVVIGPR